jgi:hypothetical protein
MAYIGVQPTDTYLSIASQQITGTGSATYTLNYSVSDEESVAVFVNNVRQNVSSYTVSGDQLTLGGTISASDECWVLFLGKTVGTKTPAVGSVTNDMLAGSIATSKISNLYPYRNLIINGDMSIAQRSTSVASISSVGYYTIDRFKLTDASSGTWTQSQSTDVPTGQGFATSLKMDCTTADASPGSGDSLVLQQLIEGQNLQYLKKGTSSAESTTLSFWVKSNKTGTYICELRDIDNNRTISQSYTISSANTWEKKTITFAGDTTGALGNDNAESLRCNFYLNAGSDYTSGTLQTSWSGRTDANRAVGQVNLADSTANEWYITGVQLEVGTSASDFEFLPYDVNLNRCYRYYYKRISTDPYGPLAQGMQIGASDMMIQGYHPITMRASPTMSISGTWNYEAGTTSGTWSIGSQRTNPTAWAAQSSFSNTNGSAAIIYANNDSTAALIGSAEL